MFRKWADVLWPISGTLLGLLVMPVAIAQYPDFFNENHWLLPTSTAIVLICWCVPLLLHERAQRIVLAIASIPRFGPVLAIMVCIAVIFGLLFGGRTLFRLHSNHLSVMLARNKPTAQGEQPQQHTATSANAAPREPIRPQSSTSPARSPGSSRSQAENYDLSNITEAFWFGVHVPGSAEIEEQFRNLDENTLRFYSGDGCNCVNTVDNLPAEIYDRAWQSTFGKLLVCDPDSDISSGMTIIISQHPSILLLLANGWRNSSRKCEMKASVMPPMTTGIVGFVLTAPSGGSWPSHGYILDLPRHRQEFALRLFVNSTELKQLAEGYLPPMKSLAINDTKDILQLSIYRKAATTWAPLPTLERSLPDKITLTADLLYGGPKVVREYKLVSRVPQRTGRGGDTSQIVIWAFFWKPTRYAEEHSVFP
jgi:hypothetical protein